MSDTSPNTRPGAECDPRGRVTAIHIAPDRMPTPMERVEEVDAIAERGIRGDRYFRETGSYDVRDDLEPSDVTLIEAEAIAAAEQEYGISIPPGSTRRNVTTRDVPLNHLVDREFEVGEATFRGIALCEPCGPMEQVADVPDMAESLVHRGGLDAAIVESGRIREGDEIRY